MDNQLTNGTPLERLRVRQMKVVVEDGPIQTVALEHIKECFGRIILVQMVNVIFTQI